MPATDDDTPLPFSLPTLCKKKITAACDGGQISSDGGVLLLAGADTPEDLRWSRRKLHQNRLEDFLAQSRATDRGGRSVRGADEAKSQA
jgi:hypothetical protein